MHQVRELNKDKRIGLAKFESPMSRRSNSNGSNKDEHEKNEERKKAIVRIKMGLL